MRVPQLVPVCLLTQPRRRAYGLSGSLIFCFILAAFVWLSTKAVDRFTTILIVGMVVAFFLSTAGLLSSVKTEVLFNSIAEGEQTYLPYLLTALPVCFPWKCTESRKILRS